MYLIKFSYYGPAFESFTYIKGKNTVVGTIREYLDRICENYVLKVSSRTDRNVSALSNAFGLICDRNINIIMKYLNTIKKPIFFHSYAEVQDDFNPRHAKCRKYIYIYDKKLKIDEEIKNRILELVGERDFSKFARKDNRNPVRKITEIKFHEMNKITVFEITGESFLWNQVRRMVGYIIYGKNDILMKSENLILKDVCYDIIFNKFFPENGNYDTFYLDFLVRRTIINYLEGRRGIEPL